MIMRERSGSIPITHPPAKNFTHYCIDILKRLCGTIECITRFSFLSKGAFRNNVFEKSNLENNFIAVLTALPLPRLSADTVGADKSIITSCIKHVAHILTASDKSLGPAIEYGQQLDQFENKDIDSLTIYNVTYWKAFFNTSSTEPSVPLSGRYCSCGTVISRNPGIISRSPNSGRLMKTIGTVDEFRKMVAEKIKAPEELYQTWN